VEFELYLAPETDFLQLQAQNSETFFQFIWDKPTLNSLKRLLKTFCSGV